MDAINGAMMTNLASIQSAISMRVADMAMSVTAENAEAMIDTIQSVTPPSNNIIDVYA